MAAIYYNLIKAGRRTIDSVPTNLREEVQAMLDADSTSA
ncbi:CD1375 family protein [Brevibacillus choshinensis]|nr:CD1375 family protein [Brevibacillus choshinensis]